MGYSEPYAQYTPALVAPPPGSDVIEEWEFFYGLAQRMGLELTLYPLRAETGVLRERRDPVPVDMASKPTTDELYESLMHGSRIPLSELKRHPHGAVFADTTILVAPADPDADDRLDVGNATMLAELAAIRRENFSEASDAALPFRLISRRMPNVYNSSGRDIAALSKGRSFNPAYLHPDDLSMLGIEPGERLEIASTHARIFGIAEAAPELRRGIVSMAHCFGDAPRHDRALHSIGSNTGRLIDNESDFDPHTGIPRMSAIPVSVCRAPEAS